MTTNSNLGWITWTTHGNTCREQQLLCVALAVMCLLPSQGILSEPSVCLWRRSSIHGTNACGVQRTRRPSLTTGTWCFHLSEKNFFL